MGSRERGNEEPCARVAGKEEGRRKKKEKRKGGRPCLRLVVFSESDWARLVVVGEDDRQQDAGDVKAHALIGVSADEYAYSVSPTTTGE